MALLLYWHTLRHYRAAQLTARAQRRWKRPDLVPGSGQGLRPGLAPLGIDPWRECALGTDGTFTFLNETRDVTAGWNAPNVPKLWLYNLHYFDWVNAQPAPSGTAAVAWITRWIAENPAAQGVGWEPYPLSLRIVNWIKWLLRHDAADPAALITIARSLELQAHVLSQCLENDLLGNHLFENAKALMFAGCFFAGSPADNWFALGARVLSGELVEQILPDGGYFELSPMYHSIVLEGILDLLSLQDACPDRPWTGNGLEHARLERIARSMLAWLNDMIHADGQIALFNDATMGVAPSPALLTRYADAIGVGVRLPPRTEGVRTLSASGFIRVDRGLVSAILDVGNIGPDHVPGHGHADTLTFELSLAGRRVIVDSGTSVYGESPERLRQRGTAAHNTVIVDDCDSSEIWKGFRVGRRARPFEITIDTAKDVWAVGAAHDGYHRLPGRVIHRRRWEFGADSLVVADRIEGRYRSARARFHFHPDIEIMLRGREGNLLWSGDCSATFAITRGQAWIEDATYHPEFGCSIRNRCLVVDVENAESMVTFSFGAAGKARG